MPDVDIFGLPLDEYLNVASRPDDDASNWTVTGLTNDDEALWTMRKLAQAQREIDRITRQAKVEIERIEAWYRANVMGAQDVVETCDKLLSEYLKKIRKESTDNIKSLTFPDGTISSRHADPKVAVTDDKAFIAWAKENAPHFDWVRVKEEVALSELKKMVDLDAENNRVLMTSGEVIPGLGVTPGGITTSIQVAE